MSTEITRGEDGRFIKGRSGNPAGRPKGTKNKIVALKQELELAVREGLKLQDVSAIVQAMVTEAKAGNVSAAKLLLDKVMSNATGGDDVNEQGGGFTIRIENLTATLAAPEAEAIEGEVINQEEDQ